MIAFVTLATLLVAANAAIVPLDTPEVALAKAEHLAILGQTHLRGLIPSFSPLGLSPWTAPVVISHETPEVALKSAEHIAIMAAEGARNVGLPVGLPISAISPWTVGKIEGRTAEAAARNVEAVAQLEAQALRSAAKYE